LAGFSIISVGSALDAFDDKAEAIHQRRFERYVVIREASGNGTVALVIALAVIASATTFPATLWIIWSTAIVGLARFHLANARRCWNYMKLVASRPPKRVSATNAEYA
jgi:hypothetical protein